jgi:hypothetical protein
MGDGVEVGNGMTIEDRGKGSVQTSERVIFTSTTVVRDIVRSSLCRQRKLGCYLFDCRTVCMRWPKGVFSLSFAKERLRGPRDAIRRLLHCAFRSGHSGACGSFFCGARQGVCLWRTENRLCPCNLGLESGGSRSEVYKHVPTGDIGIEMVFAMMHGGPSPWRMMASHRLSNHTVISQKVAFHQSTVVRSCVRQIVRILV